MAESTLSITRTEIKTALRRYLQYALTGSLSTDQTTNVDQIIELGENMFYKGTRLPGEQTVHTWSFLTPKMTIAVTADDYSYTLADDFGGFFDNYLTYDTTDNADHTLRLTSMEHLDELRSTGLTVSVDYPTFGAVNLRPRVQTTGQRFELLLYPTPAVDCTLYGKYYSNPNAISDAATYPLGGQPHGLTLLQACLAAAELYMNDGLEGIHMREFYRMMADSVALDRARTTPAYFGKNLDNSRFEGRLSRRHLARGVIYDP